MILVICVNNSLTDIIKETQPQLMAFLQEQAKSTQKRITVNTGMSVNHPLFYSASTGYGVSSLHEYLVTLSREYKNERR